MKEYQIKENEAGQRLDKYLQKLMKEASASFLYKMLRKKNITLNKKKATGKELLEMGDSVTLFLSDETFQKFSTGSQAQGEYEFLQNLKIPDLSIVYENEDFIAINKPAGMLSQKAQNDDISANEYLLAYFVQKGKLSQDEFLTFRPSIVNRLDRNTSGILVAGKSLRGLQDMSLLFKTRNLTKIYHCIVLGHMQGDGHIEGFLLKDENTNQVTVTQKQKPESVKIITEYRPIVYKEPYTLLEVHLITGKTHQIRAHLASIDHPIIGDPKYGNVTENRKAYKKYGITHQLLHAYQLLLPDGTSIQAPEPAVFHRIMN